MPDNEVVIYARIDDDTASGWAKTRAHANKTASDLEADFTKAGPKLGDGLSKGFLSRFGDLAPNGLLSGITSTVPAMGQAGGILGAALAPTLGAAVAAGVAGIGGGAGIIGGFKIAANDPGVKSATAHLKTTIGDDLKDAASGFVPVALTSIGKLKVGFAGVLPDIQAIFAKSSTFVDPLLDGVIRGGTKIVKSISRVVEGATPTFEAFGRLFEGVGTSVSEVFDSLADNGAQGASAIDDLSIAFSNTIETVGGVINILAELKGHQDSLDGWIDAQRAAFEDTSGLASLLGNLGINLDITADGYEKGSEAAQLYREGVIGAAGSTNDYNHYLEEQKEKQDAATESTQGQTEALKELADEMQAQTDPLFAVLEGQRDVNEAQENYNEALKKHGPNSAEAKEALEKLGEAAFALTGKVGDAAGGFDGNLTPAMRTMLSNAGLSEKEINALEKRLKTAAAEARKWEGTYSQTYETHFKMFGKPYSQAAMTSGPGGTWGGGGLAHGGIKGAANGQTSTGLTWVGENGPELMDLPPGTSVRTAGDSARVAAAGMAGGGGMSGGMAQPVIFQIDGQTFATIVLPSLQKLNRTDFGGDVTAMFPATR